MCFKDSADIDDNETETQDHAIDVERAENMDLTQSQSSRENISDVNSFRAPADTGMSSNKRRKVEKKSTTEKRMDEAYHILKVMSEKPDEDECSLYTELLCKKLRALDDNTREFAMYEINNLMYRLKQQQNKPSCSVASESNLAHVGNIQYGVSSDLYHYSNFHSQSSPHSYSQSPSNQSSHFHSQSSFHSHSPVSPEFQPSPHSHSQPSTHSYSQLSPDFQPSPHSHSQSSPHSHSQSPLESTLQEDW